MGFLGGWNDSSFMYEYVGEMRKLLKHRQLLHLHIYSTVTYMSPTKMVTVKQTLPMFIHAKTERTT